MTRYLFSPLARQDLQNIHDYIAERDFDAALDFATRLDLACERLAKMPELGRKRDELLPRLRSFPVGRHIIFYRIMNDGVEIARILYGAQDVEGVFADKATSRKKKSAREGEKQMRRRRPKPRRRSQKKTP